MDFSEKEAMPWAVPDPASSKTGFFDFPYVLPEIPFPSLSEVSQFFYLPEADFSMFPLKRDEETDVAYPMFYFQPDAGLAPPEPKQPDPEPTTPTTEPLRPRVPYPHAKKVGTISIEERRLKIERYLEKRNRRTYGKKVSYECRKRVADTRIRVKGRFVAKNIAEALKGMENERNNVALHLLK